MILSNIYFTVFLVDRLLENKVCFGEIIKLCLSGHSFACNDPFFKLSIKELLRTRLGSIKI